MAKKIDNQAIEVKPIVPKRFVVSIQGDSDLILNKMNDYTVRMLTREREDKTKDLEKPNYWECVITSLHWLNGKPSEFSEESFIDALKNNAPCISGFGFKKSLSDAIVRNEIAQYGTKIQSTVNVLGEGDNLIPIRFTEHHIDSKLMSPKKGSPVLVYLNRFSGWSADIVISLIDTVYSVEQLINIINLSGFGIGIGSGRSSGYGRYHVTGLRMVDDGETEEIA